jgi:hypothetical protein
MGHLVFAPLALAALHTYWRSSERGEAGFRLFGNNNRKAALSALRRPMHVTNARWLCNYTIPVCAGGA